MNRFSFRAWDRTSKAMIRDYAHLKMYGELYVTQFHSLAYSDKGCPNLILMQSTGLPDKSGKEIYEGDIVEVGHYQTHPITVEGFHGYRFMWGKDQLTKSVGIDGEIIGNVMENPELLEAADENNP